MKTKPFVRMERVRVNFINHPKIPISGLKKYTYAWRDDCSTKLFTKRAQTHYAIGVSDIYLLKQF
jgi:hypothetical protein